MHCIARLSPEPANPVDPGAIKVEVNGRLVGHLSIPDAVEYHAAMRAQGAEGRVALCDAYINGGWRNGDDEGHFGVKLGLAWPPEVLA